ncbi:outer membrane protein [Epilithonimonas bovis DSM 19482]|uniref:Outer membrane protein n=1 Tax=Epilithonimonas bovis DSM 19482 TaxID=1121284 RepID=A0A1U7PU98_9FLAO|nr:TolC family protein [Epilithonimonas bovis]MDN5626931.1 TolC family protein [Weeksellaceae bacterium]SIT97125.1 outer membrane protein [Epilithonimonas bovis DSM 19482]
MQKYLILTLFIGIITPAQKVWTLGDCLDYAVKNNITVKKTVLDKTTASLNYQQQKNNKLPTVYGSASLGVTNGSSIDPITSSFLNQNILSNSFGLSGNMTIYQGNKLNLQIEQNRMILDQSALYQKQAENNIVLNVLNSYLQALYYYEGIESAKYTANSSAQELKLTETKYKNEAISKLELADVETQNAQNLYTVVNAENLYNQQVLKLKQLLELDPSVDFQIEKIKLSDAMDAVPDKQEVFSQAIENLPDLKIYDSQNEILTKALEITKTGYKPTLSATAGFNTGYTTTQDYSYFNQVKNNFNKSVGLSLNVPIFSKKQNDTNVKLAQINIEQNKLDKISASKTLYSSIETAWQNAIANQAQQKASKVARDNAKLSYDLAGKKYEFGGLTTTELAVSRNTYLTNEQTYLQSKYMSALYTQLLNFYQGKALTAD